ncbi:MAG: DNA repair protein RecN [Acidobacteriia bacterium]|nr:DNA repair protein RecN [Terriglobia bacterium]
MNAILEFEPAPPRGRNQPYHRSEAISQRFAIMIDFHTMLRHLLISNYALIDQLEMEFHGGLNLLSGETGSGKSIIVDALGLLLGSKASPEMVRTGCDHASVTGVFHIDKSPPLTRFLDAQGVECDGEELILKREISREGKSRAFINHQPITVSTLKSLGRWLVDIHGQNEQQALTDSDAQLALVDEFAGNQDLLEELATHAQRLAAIRSRREALEHSEKEQDRLADLLSFQKKEIETAQLKPGEDEALNVEHRLLANATKLFEVANAVYASLYESETAAARTVSLAERSLETIARIDDTLAENVEQLRSARIQVEDVALSMRDYLRKIDISPGRLPQVESRMAEIEKLRRKYGSTVNEILEFHRDVVQQLQTLEHRDEELESLQQEMNQLSQAYLSKAKTLSDRRQRTALELEKALEHELKELAMERTRFKVQFNRSPVEFSPTGFDAVEYMVSPNVGEALKPLARIASGGEISRLMLALKTITHADSRIKTMVFDEVDAGIGGRTAEVLGRKLKSLAQENQILCVTHLPQIASFADHHYFIEKVELRGRTVTRVEHLAEDDRINELARMLSGARITDAVKKHARELLKQSRN